MLLIWTRFVTGVVEATELVLQLLQPVSHEAFARFESSDWSRTSPRRPTYAEAPRIAKATIIVCQSKAIVRYNHLLLSELVRISIN